jgi:predicted aminopeptidase
VARFFDLGARWGGVLLAGVLAGCANVGYYVQSINGQFDLVQRARPIETVLADEGLPESLKEKLRQAVRIRRFASEALSLPDNPSYTEYAELERPFAVWNVFAAPELSLTPRQWCFPIVGCVFYRGYFSEADAQDFAVEQAAQGDDVYVGGVPAYSTLGWFDDPLLNTVMHYPEEELAGLVFHELAHQVAYAKGDTTFNESFATAVELEGVKRWLAAGGSPERAVSYRQRKRRNQAVVALILRYRGVLETVYAADQSDQWKRWRKEETIIAMKNEYRGLVSGWPGYRGYRSWFAQPINNAQLASVAAYFELVTAFENLLARKNGDLASFYQAVKELASMDRDSRRRALRAPAIARRWLAPGDPAQGIDVVGVRQQITGYDLFHAARSATEDGRKIAVADTVHLQ